LHKSSGGEEFINWSPPERTLVTSFSSDQLKLFSARICASELVLYWCAGAWTCDWIAAIFELDQDIHVTSGGSIAVKKSPSVTKQNGRPTTNYEAAAVPAIGDSPI